MFRESVRKTCRLYYTFSDLVPILVRLDHYIPLINYWTSNIPWSIFGCLINPLLWLLRTTSLCCLLRAQGTVQFCNSQDLLIPSKPPVLTDASSSSSNTKEMSPVSLPPPPEAQCPPSPYEAWRPPYRPWQKLKLLDFPNEILLQIINGVSLKLFSPNLTQKLS